MGDTNVLRPVHPAGWPPAKGYANGMCSMGRGERVLFVAGQVGWLPDGTFATDDFAEQFGQALDNVLSVVRAAGGEPSSIARMTVYVTSLDAYRASTGAVGQAWRARMGRHFPAMALVGVTGLVEPRAKVEIEATCVLPGTEPPRESRAVSGEDRVR
jgi:enamine deaminase RidA (YjgF/YER057c/UK114 family)